MEEEIKQENLRWKMKQKEKMDKARSADQPLPEIKHLLDLEPPTPLPVDTKVYEEVKNVTKKILKAKRKKRK